MTKAALSLLFFFVGAFTHASSSPIYCLAHNTSGYAEAKLSPHAQAAVNEGQNLLNTPSVTLLRVLNATADWRERGQLNFGVFEITGSDGLPVVLKILDSDQFIARGLNGLLLDFDGELGVHAGLNMRAAAFKEYVDLHAILGQLNAAPKLIAIITGSSLRKAVRSNWSFLKEAAEKLQFNTSWISKPRLAGGGAVGIVMQKLPLILEQGPLHPINRPMPPHPFMKRWSQADVERAVRDLIEIRRRAILAGVHLNDRQFVATGSASVYIIDLDQARFNPELAVTLDISEEATKVISQWETASGQTFDPALRSHLLSEGAIPYGVCGTDADFAEMFSDWRKCEQSLVKKF